MILLLSFLMSLSVMPRTAAKAGTVTTVHDGNTISVTANDGEKYRVVLMGIDCPELKQPYGIEAKQFLERLVLEREIEFVVHGKDRLGNYVGIVLLEEAVDVRVHLLEEGLAWTAEKDPIKDLEAIRLRAMKERKGLWGDDEPVAPWVFRRQQSMLEPKSQ